MRNNIKKGKKNIVKRDNVTVSVAILRQLFQLGISPFEQMHILHLRANKIFFNIRVLCKRDIRISLFSKNIRKTPLIWHALCLICRQTDHSNRSTKT